MKRVALSLVSGTLAVLFLWLFPFMTGLLWPGDGMQHHGEDEAGRQLQVYFVFGGILFFALGAWVGSVAAGDWRRAGRMAAGILIATVAVVLIPRGLVPAGLQFDDWRYDAIFMAVWAAVSAGCAYKLGRHPWRSVAPR